MIFQKLFQKKTSKKEEKKPYVLYKSNLYGELANRFVEKYTIKYTKKYSKFFEKLNISLSSSGIKILSKTYIGMMIFSSLLAAVIMLAVGFLFIKGNIILTVIGTVFLAIFVFIVYMYPGMVTKSMSKRIKDDLPFVIVHMNAVAGSGAHPISMFNLVLNSKEYKGIEGEIKKIVNYVNLFGYDLSTALKAVAKTTPSKDFRELLNGLVNTVETGGSLKEYLDAKASDALVNYRLERKKYVESLSTYSDVYTGLSIAAPMMFFLVLALINLPILGGTIFGLGVPILASVGTYVIIPLLNIGFIVFLNIIQPKG